MKYQEYKVMSEYQHAVKLYDSFSQRLVQNVETQSNFRGMVCISEYALNIRPSRKNRRRIKNRTLWTASLERRPL